MPQKNSASPVAAIAQSRNGNVIKASSSNAKLESSSKLLQNKNHGSKAQSEAEQVAVHVHNGNRAPAVETLSVRGPSEVRPQGWDECVNYARKINSKKLVGKEFVKAWKTTCEPATHTPEATERYKIMCDSLVGAVEPFSNQSDFDVFGLCTHVLTVFHDVIVP